MVFLNTSQDHYGFLADGFLPDRYIPDLHQYGELPSNPRQMVDALDAMCTPADPILLSKIPIRTNPNAGSGVEFFPCLSGF